MIDLLLETIIPQDKELGLPSAAAIGFDQYVVRQGLGEAFEEFTSVIDRVSQERFTRPFCELDVDTRLAAVNASRTQNMRLFSVVISHVFRAYYTHHQVLLTIGSGSVPPFPDGNILEDDDWSFLQPVFARGQIFKDI